MNRLFLALPVTLLDYKSIQNDFENVIRGRWVPIENLHLTLKFLGDTFEKEFLIDRLSSLHFHVESSELKGLECFQRKQVIYAKTHNPALERIHRQIEEALDLPHDEAFLPHVTLTRIKKVHHGELFTKRLHLYDEKLIGTLHPTIQLIQSNLTPEGAIYTLIKEF